MFDSYQFFNTSPICCLFTAFVFSYNFINWYQLSLRQRKEKSLLFLSGREKFTEKSLVPDEDMVKRHEGHPSREEGREVERKQWVLFLFCYHGDRNCSQTLGFW